MQGYLMNVLQLLYPPETYKKLLEEHKKDKRKKLPINWIGKEFRKQSRKKN